MNSHILVTSSYVEIITGRIISYLHETIGIRRVGCKIKSAYAQREAANRTTDTRLLKLVLIVVILAAVAAFICRRIAL